MIVTQLNKFVNLYYCNNNITQKMTVIAAETCCKNVVNKLGHNIEVHFVSYLYITDILKLDVPLCSRIIS
jgi:uncharacterized protein YlbG (UPF0298 family)